MARPRISPNQHEILYAQSDASGNAVPLTYNTVNGGLDVNVVAGGGGGGADVQYLELSTTSPATGTLALGRYRASLPTLTDGQMNEPILDVSSRLSLGTSTANIGLVTLSDSTNSASILKSDGTAAGWNALMTAGSYREMASLAAGSLNADLVPSTDVSAYRWLSLQVTGTFSGTLTFQGSNDNVNFISVTMTNVNATSGAGGNTTTSTSIFEAGVSYRYFRVRMTAYVSGTATGVLEMYTQPSNLHTIGVGGSLSQAGTWTVQPGNTPNTSPWLVDIHATAAPLADATANPTTSLVGALGLVWNGTNWDRARNAAHGLNTATGVPGSGMIAELDDVSPTAVTENQLAVVRLSADRTLLVSARSTTGTATSIAGSATSVAILAANTARKGGTIRNDSTALLYLELTSGAATTSSVYKLPQDTMFEVPFGYIGVINGIWASATGNARILELT